MFILLLSVIGLLSFHLVHKQQPTTTYERPWFQDRGLTKQYDISCYTDTCEVFLSSSIDERSNYIGLVKLIETAPKDSTINIHLSGDGGSTDTVIYIGNAVKLSKATVNTIIDGPVYSAHAYLALLGKKITFAPNVFLMFHGPAALVRHADGSTEYISIDDVCNLVNEKDKDRGQSARRKCVEGNVFYKEAVYNYLKTFGKGYLDDNEMKAISDGYDVYISGLKMSTKNISK